MAAKLYYSSFIPAFSSNGAPVPGAKLNFYLTGTSTRSPIYAESSLTTPLSNPVVADASGKYPPIYLNEAVTYRVVQTTGAGVQIGDEVDPYIPGQALKGDPGGDASQIGLFSEASSLTIADGIDVVRTSGYSTLGVGAATFIRDDDVDAAYVTASPSGMAFVSANGVGFLMSEQAVTLEMFGAARTMTTANDQPAFERAIAAGVALGVPVMPLRDYWLHSKARTSYLHDQFHPSGHWGIAQGDVSLIAFKMCRFYFRGPSGNDPSTTGGWQVIPENDGDPNNAVWRGVGIRFLRPDDDPGGWLHYKFTRRNVIFDGGCAPTASKSTPASLVDGSGWDYTHRPYEAADSSIAFDLDWDNVKDIGWRGEVLYGVGGPSTLTALNTLDRVPIARIRNYESSGNNVNCNNLGGHIIHDVENCIIADGSAGEVLAPQGGRYHNVLFRDTTGGVYCGGPSPDYPSPQIFMQARDDAAAIPMLVMTDIRLQNAAASWDGTPGGNASPFRFGGMVHVEFSAIDTPIGIYPVGRHADITLIGTSMLDRLPDRSENVLDIANGCIDLVSPVSGMPAAISLSSCTVAAGTATLTTTGNPSLLAGMTLSGGSIPPYTRIVSGSGNTWTISKTIAGGASSATRSAGFFSEPMVNLNIKMDVHRSKGAIVAGRRWIAAFTAYGLTDAKSVSLTFAGEGVTNRSGWWLGSPNPKQAMPFIDERDLRLTYDFGSFENNQNETISGTINNIEPVFQSIDLIAGGGGTFDFGLVATPTATGEHANKYAHGQIVEIYHRAGGSVTANIAISGTGWVFSQAYSMSEKTVLVVQFDAVNSKWTDIGFRASA